MKKQWRRKFERATVVEPTRNAFILPAFIHSVPTWADASLLLALYPINNADYKFSFKLPLSEFGTAFIPAIRWVEDGIVHRFKFWEGGVLYFPVYNGERIGYNAILEIWTVDSDEAPELEEAQSLISSIFEFPANCNKCGDPVVGDITLIADDVPDDIPPDTNCNPFCENLSTLCNS